MGLVIRLLHMMAQNIYCPPGLSAALLLALGFCMNGRKLVINLNQCPTHYSAVMMCKASSTLASIVLTHPSIEREMQPMRLQIDHFRCAQ